MINFLCPCCGHPCRRPEIKAESLYTCGTCRSVFTGESITKFKEKDRAAGKKSHQVRKQPRTKGKKRKNTGKGKTKPRGSWRRKKNK